MMGSRCVCILLVIAAVTCVAPHSFSRAAASASCSEEATLGRWYPIELASNKVFIAGSVGNSRLLRFILDTGAPSGFIDDSLVEELGFAKTNVSRGRGGAAGSQEIVLSRLEPTACQTAAGAVLPNEAFRALKLSDISRVEGLRVDGLVGGDFFRQHVVEIDYAKKKIRMLRASFEYRGRGTLVPIKIEGGQIFTLARVVNAAGEMVEATFMVDTGFRTAISFSGPFAEAHHLTDSVPNIPEATMGIGAGGESKAMIFRLPTLQLAGLRWENVVATASLDKSGLLSRSDFAGVIGGDVLRRYRVFLDYPHGRLVLEKTASSDEPFEYDKSGMFLVSDPPDYHAVRVLRVIPGTPAAQAGIRENDVIMSVNSKPATALGLDEIRVLFRLNHISYDVVVARQGEKELHMRITTKKLFKP